MPKGVYKRKAMPESVKAKLSNTINAKPKKTHCPQGHEYTEENTSWETRSEGRLGRVRKCRICKRKRLQAYNRTEHGKRVKKDCNMKALYGISLEEAEQTKKAQNYLCGLCGKPLGDDSHFDHDHESGKPREYLHSNCNTAIGLLQDSSELCRKAAEYLERHGR